jgi:hypothetical protein
VCGRYAVFLKALSLHTHGVLTADEFALVIHDIMLESSELKRWYVGSWEDGGGRRGWGSGLVSTLESSDTDASMPEP